MLRNLGFAVAALFLSCALLAQQALNNDSVIKLVKAGLSDDLIATTINASSGNYDTSASGLIALKGAGVSDRVLSAIVIKSSGGAPASPNPAASTSLASNGIPPGIDEIGVYYKNKSGAWVTLMPEVVNFKTGGVMKSIASAGIVKGDVNGHIVGSKARTALAFPIFLAVYAPEGVAITEYQLLRLHSNSGSREFRSVTGGVMHVSGGATRDLIDFQGEKLAPRVYEIKMESTLGKGEFGLLPPGAYGSSNLGSSGKIYSMSVPE